MLVQVSAARSAGMLAFSSSFEQFSFEIFNLFIAIIIITSSICVKARLGIGAVFWRREKAREAALFSANVWSWDGVRGLHSSGELLVGLAGFGQTA
jgi:hypothetical protein